MHVLLTMTTGDGGQRPFRLTKKCSVIGRSHRCDLRLALPSVAMQHCEITSHDGVAAVRRLRPASTALLNGKPFEAAVLRSGDLLQVGSVEFRVELLDEAAAPNDDPSDREVVETKPDPTTGSTMPPPLPTTPTSPTAVPVVEEKRGPG